MTIEQYILMRKKEDGLNEYDLSKRSENIRICVNYIFEYFDNYLENSPDSEKTFLEEQKQDKYRQLVSEYSPDVQDWLVELNSRTGKHVHLHLKRLIDDTYFLLFNTDSEFRSLSYAIYPKAIKKVKALEGEGEMIYKFIRDKHRIRSEFTLEDQSIHITDNIDQWISNTFKKYGVNIFAFCSAWCSYFSFTPALWEKQRKKRNHEYDSLLEDKRYDLSSYMFWDYDYKADGERFGLNTLYRNMPKKDFTRGKKQYFDAVMMYWWTHFCDNDEKAWEEYRVQLEEKSY
ncbi:MAG: hypothetical protein IJH81_03190 [Lachnospiraceae bacterium]|nr:hypothetical protein [Lachnospiraceae bacterium]MBQ6364424.1 hypothetical protein [Lachnospiraceae bacterium]MBQ6635358.1 hypothetical protein [Lachnospiraceae bacterium]